MLTTSAVKYDMCVKVRLPFLCGTVVVTFVAVDMELDRSDAEFLPAEFPNFSTCSIVVSSRITSTASFKGVAVGWILCPVTSVYFASILARASGICSWMTDSLRCDISGTTYESCFSLRLCVSLDPTLQACICTDVMFPILLFLLL